MAKRDSAIFMTILLALILIRPIKGEEDTAPLTNTLCPVLTDEKVDAKISLVYEGKKVFLCCPKCRVKFLQTPEKYLANLPQFQATPAAETKPADAPADHGPAHDHGGAVAPGTMKPMPNESGMPNLPGNLHHHGPDPEQPVGIDHLFTFLGRFHPLVVHLPIALILVSGLLELLGWWTKRELLQNAARINLVLGALSAIVAAPLGWAAAAYTRFPGMEDTLFWHRWSGTTLTVLAVVAATLIWANHRRPNPKLEGGYRAFLIVLCLLVAITGHLGGSLVFGPDHLSW